MAISSASRRLRDGPTLGTRGAGDKADEVQSALADKGVGPAPSEPTRAAEVSPADGDASGLTIGANGVELKRVDGFAFIGHETQRCGQRQNSQKGPSMANQKGVHRNCIFHDEGKPGHTAAYSKEVDGMFSAIDLVLRVRPQYGQSKDDKNGSPYVTYLHRTCWTKRQAGVCTFSRRCTDVAPIAELWSVLYNRASTTQKERRQENKATRKDLMHCKKKV